MLFPSQSLSLCLSGRSCSAELGRRGHGLSLDLSQPVTCPDMVELSLIHEINYRASIHGISWETVCMPAKPAIYPTLTCPRHEFGKLLPTWMKCWLRFLEHLLMDNESISVNEIWQFIDLALDRLDLWVFVLGRFTGIYPVAEGGAIARFQFSIPIHG